MTTTAFVDRHVKVGRSTRRRRDDRLAAAAAYLLSSLTRRVRQLGVTNPADQPATEHRQADQARFYASTGRRWV